MTVKELWLEPVGPSISMTGFLHTIELYAVDERFKDWDQRVALLDVTSAGSASAFLDWDDIVAIHAWTEYLIKERAEHEQAEQEEAG